MSMIVERPPVPAGSAEAQLRSLYGYLYRMAETLNVALDAVGGSSTAAENVSAASVSRAQSDEALRSLIVNTAAILRSEMDTLETVLRGKLSAVSEQWGMLREELVGSITATAEGVLQRYGYAADIETLEQQAAGLQTYRLQTEGFIRQGFVERDADGVPVVGIAIGQGLTGVTQVVNGQTVLALDDTVSCAFYTAERVSFRIGGREVAYLSNRKLHIAEAAVDGGLTLGGRWLLESNGGLCVKWIGC